jgi:DNA ligase D-like protein (predicted 3'-phosphoesterase)
MVGERLRFTWFTEGRSEVEYGRRPIGRNHHDVTRDTRYRELTMKSAGNNKDDLEEYKAKRDFLRTPEPPATPGDAAEGRPRFVLQKHQASHLHFDLRLEVDGVLKSWAVPRGPSLDPGQKRLAVATEDHPLDYIHFEGVIPEGEYGAGVVMVWDTGTYRNIKEEEPFPVSMAKAILNGHVTVWLEGRRLKGGFALIRTSRGWLLIKMDDPMAEPGQDPVETEVVSVLSGKTMEEIAQG